jgi:hypothetical protein
VLNGVTLEVNLHTLRQETLASGAAAASDDVTALSRLHASTEAELLLARPLGWLVGPLAHRLLMEKMCECEVIGRRTGGNDTFSRQPAKTGAQILAEVKNLSNPAFESRKF